MSKIKKSGSGFTLLELAVVGAIITILALIILPNYRQGEKQSALLRSTHKLAQDLRRAEEMAISAQKTPPEFDPEESFPKGGYGIYFEINPPQDLCLSALEGKGYCIILFADCDGEADFDPRGSSFTCAGATPGAGYSYNETMEELTLEEGIKIKNLQLLLSDGSLLPVDSLSVTFTPPEPTVTIQSEGAEGENEAVVTLSVKDNPTITRTITVNKAGLIETKKP